MENQSNYIRLVIHELRTPLTSIKAASEYLLRNTENNLNEKQNNFLKMIKLNCERVIKITSDFSLLHKLENDLAQMNWQEVALEEIIGTVYQDIKGKADEKGVEVNLPDFSKKNFIKVDPAWLREALYLILERAVAFTPNESTVDIAVKKNEKKSAAEASIQLTISDASPGLEVGDSAKIFDKFADIFLGGENPKLKGSGLEFALCAEIIKRLKGRIEVKSAPKKGNQFIIELPLVENSQK